jgi:cobalt-zinc-cadmium efflux system membrane fusion protein
MSDATILLVDDDPVLSQVLHRVLVRQGYQVVDAGTIADALAQARQQRPSLGLIDLCLPDGDGVELARQLEKEIGPLPLILMTAYPLRLRDQPELAQGFAQVLTKPLNLEELRHTIDKALAGTPPAPAPIPAVSSPAPRAPARPEPVPQPAVGPELRQPATRRRLVMWGVVAAVAILIAVLVLGLPAIGMPPIADWFTPKRAASAAPATPTVAGAQLVGPDTIELPAEVAKSLVGATKVVETVATPRTLVLSGSLSFDLNHFYRIQSRFPGEVIELGKTAERGTPETNVRPLRYGDHVRKGDLLAIVLCKDLGEKKSELVDNLVKLHVDQLALDRYEKLAEKGYLPEATLLAQQATVSSDQNAVNRVWRTLVTWKVDPREIAAVEAEARRVQDNPRLRDPAKEAQEWAWVKIHAPADGTIVEKNVAVGNMVDTTFDLYKIADLHTLGVVVNAYEEDLNALRQLTLPYPWTVEVPAEGWKLDKPGQPSDKRQTPELEQIGRIVDPTQHTAPVMGPVDNRDGKLKVGQFVTATAKLEPPPGVLSLPASALDEDGESSIVFVQPDPSRPVYTRHRVAVTQRLGDVVYVRRDVGGLEPGKTRVAVEGVVQLKSTLESLKAAGREKQ